MRAKLFALMLAVLTLTQIGCATGFRATGPRGGGLAAGAGVGQPVAPIVVQRNGYIPPPPPEPPPTTEFR